MNLREPQREWRFRHFCNKIIPVFSLLKLIIDVGEPQTSPRCKNFANHKLFLAPAVAPAIHAPVLLTH